MNIDKEKFKSRLKNDGVTQQLKAGDINVWFTRNHMVKLTFWLRDSNGNLPVRDSKGRLRLTELCVSSEELRELGQLFLQIADLHEEE
jgi:hypothetical protein